MISSYAVVVGGGIAGASAGHALSEFTSVVLVEREPTLAYHTTGRSAAHFFENYGQFAMRALSRSSRGFFEDPPTGLADSPLLGPPTGGLIVGRQDQFDLLEQEARDGKASNASIEMISGAQATELIPVLKPEAAVAAVWEPSAVELDVAAIHQAFLRGMRKNGGKVHTSSPVTRLRRQGNRWRVFAGSETFEAEIVVNAAGAWGDVVAELAGAQPVGLEPRRRTVFMTPGVAGSSSWPLVVNAGYEWYFKPDGAQLLCSLADETPSEPCDARPREVDVALAIERINESTTLGIRTVRSSWAGLRTFAPDEDMVIGFDPDVDGLVWLVGQGGTGIQTSPAAGRLAAAIARQDGGDPYGAIGIERRHVDPARFRA